MIDVEIPVERAEQLLRCGMKTVKSPCGPSGLVFFFTGPGMSLARLAYGGVVDRNWLDFTDQSQWDIAILRIEREQKDQPR